MSSPDSSRGEPSDSGLRVRAPLRITVPLAMLAFVIAAAIWGTHLGRLNTSIQIEREGIRDLRWYLSRLEQSIESAYRDGNLDLVQAEVAVFGNLPEFLTLLVIDDQGLVIASLSQVDIGGQMDQVLPKSVKDSPVVQPAHLREVRESRSGDVHVQNGSDTLVGVYAVRLESERGKLRSARLGNIVGVMDTTALKGAAHAEIHRAIIAYLAPLVLMVVAMWWFFHVRIAGRISRVVDAADAMRVSGSAISSGVAGNDEIGRLGKAVDSMVHAIARNELELESMNNFRQSVFDAVLDGMITIDDHGIIQSVNRAAEQMFGYEPDEMIGKNVSSITPFPIRQEHDQYLETYLRTRERKIIGIGREVNAVRKDGSEFPADLSVSEAFANGRVFFTGVVRDITRRKVAEESLRRLNEELEARVKARTEELEAARDELIRKERLATLGQLAGSVAHELRNPLGVIRNNAYFLAEKQPSADPDARAAWEELNRALESSRRVITELLDFARSPRAHCADVEPKILCSQTLSMLQIPPNIQIETQISPSAMTIYADPEQMGRTLANLVQNAIQAMPQGGTVSIRFSALENGGSVIEVSDTGVGIKPEDLSKLFEPLFSRRTKGIGLGLAICKRYVELHGGTLTAANSQGKGATFRIDLPGHKADLEVAAE